MNPDPRLTESIRAHLARHSSAQLERIVDSQDLARWSPVALALAEELLRDRGAGRAAEPVEPFEDSPLPAISHDLDSLSILALNLFTLPFGFFRVPVVHTEEEVDPVALDLPVPFGPDLAWLAVATHDTAEVAKAIDLRGPRECPWAIGIPLAHRSAIYVTPPLGEWTLAVSTSLFPPQGIGEFVKPMLERLSGRFGEAQYFCTNDQSALQAWAKARRGQLVRGYAWSGAEQRTLWDEGKITKDECKESPEPGDVFGVASFWSIDPTTLDVNLKEPMMGLVGMGASADSAAKDQAKPWRYRAPPEEQA